MTSTIYAHPKLQSKLYLKNWLKCISTAIIILYLRQIHQKVKYLLYTILNNYINIIFCRQDSHLAYIPSVRPSSASTTALDFSCIGNHHLRIYENVVLMKIYTTMLCIFPFIIHYHLSCSLVITSRKVRNPQNRYW